MQSTDLDQFQLIVLTLIKTAFRSTENGTVKGEQIIVCGMGGMQGKKGKLCLIYALQTHVLNMIA